MKPGIHAYFDEATNTVSYLVGDPTARVAAIIDPVLDFDRRSGRTATLAADQILKQARELDWRIVWILETHAHADHLSAGNYLRQATGAPIAIGARITEVQTIFQTIFAMADLVPDGSAFDRLLADGDRIALGALEIEVMHTPGHTPACVSYRIGDDVFVGDTLFMPDSGSARCDFPGGSARTLFRSIRSLLSLPAETPNRYSGSPASPVAFRVQTHDPALFFQPFAAYIGVAGSPVMEINGGLPFGPGRSTRRLHIATSTSFDLPAVRMICWNFRHRRPRLLTSARCRGSMAATGESGHKGSAADPQNGFERDRT